MSTLGLVIENRLRSSKKVLKITIKRDFKGFKEPTRVLVLLINIKVSTPIKFSRKRGPLLKYIN